jgi:3-dehydroquinate synthetase
MGLSDANRHQRIIDIFQKLQMPLKIPQPLTKNQLIDIIRKDKKAVNKWPRFVLVDKIGHVFCKDGQFAIEVEIESVEKVLDELIGNN